MTSSDEQMARMLLQALVERIDEGEVLDPPDLANVALNTEVLGEAITARQLSEKAFSADADDETVRLGYASFLLDVENTIEPDLEMASELLAREFENLTWALVLRSQHALLTIGEADQLLDEMVEAYIAEPEAEVAGVLMRLREAERLDDARRIIDTWVERAPAAELTGKRSLAEFLQLSDEHDHVVEATGLYRELVEQADEDTPPAVLASDMASLALNLVLQETDIDEAVDLARQPYSKSPENPFIRSFTAQLLADVGQTDEANLVLRGQPLPV